MLDSESPTRADGLDVHETRDGIIVYSVETDEVYHFNASAALVLELCDGSRTVGEVAALVGSAFELSEAPLEDVRRIVQDSLAKSVLRL